ncbi:MAG: hypothetical protein K9J37_15915 [Saprospiraceae bacterium]|nr:hypothetical protein [Saprospiraceae bacterium]MCF8251399.1 hypothetical protein [Saprospiraceae bacterium]MCF8282634.1 hypothetical protein [Bacteroidales bacterium]MCF8312673.1 hypothetical protein [Saprospiraceae bacterium]MCF8441061.1 hypothetical protein [Saprospiraceae bacterium]
MKIWCSFIISFLVFPFLLSAQKLEKFSEDPTAFLKEMEGLMTASKNSKMEDIFKDFEKSFKSGVYSEIEIMRIRLTGDKMLEQRMPANPYFTAYMSALSLVKKSELGESRFKNWHDVLEGMLGSIENRKLKPYQDFLDFSFGFFEKNALRASDLGINWIANASRYDLVLVDNKPLIKYDKLDLIGTRGKDSILIKSTAGVYDPVEEIWKGKGGFVSWERLGLGNEVYAELTEYEFEAKKSLYDVANVKMHYPLYFGQSTIEGKFEDKLVTSNEATEGSYPRFESKERVLELKNIGEGVRLKSGFRLQGTTVYGFGDRRERAELKLYNKKNNLVYKGQAELFVVKQQERIVGEGVESAIYFGNDSLYHPSVNIRFDLNTRELQMARGKRGSDRNPFFNSFQQINIDAERMDFELETDSIYIGRRKMGIAKSAVPVVFESLKFFNENDYNRLQNISTTNPIALMKVAYQENGGDKIISANSLAQRLNPKFSVENINSLLYDLVSKGFINYNADDGLVEIKDKVLHYAEASQKKVDFDNLKISSETNETNAIFDLKDNSTSINGIQHIEFSQAQRVGLKPYGDNVKMKANRDMDFHGRLFAGFGLIEGKDFHFDYDKFQVRLDSVRYFDMFLPTGVIDKAGQPEAYSLASRIEHLNGVLLIDAPSNKSGRESIEMFPSMESKKNSFVFYDYKRTQGGAYQRDSFYFELKPFSFNSLDRYTQSDIHFKGKMVSSYIFPDFDETILVREDTSLGFVTKTPSEGYPAYQGKGKFAGALDLSNKGFLGKGTVNYLGAKIDANDLVFKPYQMTGSAERFDMEEDRKSVVQVPQVRGFDVTIDWQPYKDSMYVTSKEAPFELFTEGRHTLKGMLILTPGGLKGRGLFDWDKASMTSELISFGAYSGKADTTDLKIKAIDAGAIALSTTNLNADVDFDKQFGTFKANADVLTTTLPYNQYVTTFNEFDWDMAKETVTFRAFEGRLGNFVSIHPEQDSLFFQGKNALYDLKTNLLKIAGVPYIVSSDAFIYTETGDIEIQAGGVISELTNAKIVADTVNQYHVINRATVNILGKKEYRAKGFYEYNIADKKQEIEFAEIVGTRVGEGNHQTKRSVTRATGEINERTNFYIDHKTKFQGTITLNADKPNLGFKGFAQLQSETLPVKHWFSIDCEGDKNDLNIAYKIPLNPDGEQVFTGLFLSKETATCYPRVMMPLFFRKDRPILAVQGVMQFDEKVDKFIFSDSTRLLSGGAIPGGNHIVYDNATGKIEMEGKFNLGSALKNVSVDAAGYVKTTFGEMVTDTVLGTAAMKSDLNMEAMMGLNFPIPSNLMNIIVSDFKSSTFDATPIVYAKDMPFYRKVIRQMFPLNEDIQSAIDGISLGSLVLPKKFNQYTALFDRVPLSWDADYQSFVSTKSKIGLVSLDGDMLNTMVSAYIEVKMPTNDDDRLYIYLKSPSQMYYFFGYKQGILNLVSNNTRFMEQLLKMKDKDKIVKLPDGETFEIQPVEESTASAFLNRIEAVKKE